MVWTESASCPLPLKVTSLPLSWLLVQDVGYPEFLNIRPYMSQSSGEPVMYGLYAVLVHSGYSCHAGHYYCYVKVSGAGRGGAGVRQSRCGRRRAEGPWEAGHSGERRVPAPRACVASSRLATLRF